MIKLSEKKYGSLLANVDWSLLASALFLTLCGLLMIYSATIRTGSPVTYAARQFLALVIGMILCILVMSVNYQITLGLGYYLYAFGILLLVLVLFLGTQIRGTRGWFNLGFFYFQPVEITKVIFIVAMSNYLSVHWKSIYRLKKLIVPSMLLILNVVLILLQPDFSSALVYFPVFICMLYFTGANLIHIAYIVLFGMIAVGIPLLSTFVKIKHAYLIKTALGGFLYRSTYDINGAIVILLVITAIILLIWWFLYKLKVKLPFISVAGLILILFAGTFASFVVSRSLKDYQRTRFIVFISPGIDPLGSGYNITQSKVAIGSGRFFGKGLFGGSQVGLGFLPEQHTDFIFSAIGEELGFLGSGLIMFVYGFFIWRILVIVKDSRDRGGSLIASGIATMFIFYFLTNIGMTLGLAPVTGLPLPFVSYGGSALVSAWLAVGLLESIYSRRFTY